VLAPIAEESGARLITQAELLANAADVDGPSLTATGLTIAAGLGSLVDNGDGTWSYTPALNDDTGVSYSDTNTDGTDTVAGTASLDITPVNDPPTTSPVVLAPIAEDSGPRLITQAELLANASDVDGPGLTATGLVISSGSGSLVDNGDGSWSYMPALNDDTGVSFSYTITDGTDTVAGTASLDITPVNDPPTTSPVVLAPIAEDSGPRLITQAELLANATDVDGPSLTATGLAISAGLGSLVDNGDGTWSYTPALNDDTGVSFSYTITDGTDSVAGTASLDITPVNDPPATSPVVLAPIAEDSGPRLITQAELLANATDVDGPSLTATGLAISAGLGTLVDNGDGTWTYTPALNDDTSVSFTYTITDGTDSVAGSASLDITPVNDAPTTAPVTLVSINENSGSRLITQAELLASAADIDGPGLTATGLAISAGGGTLVDNGDGTWSYTPALNDSSSVSFGYTITDGTDFVAGSASLDIIATPVTILPPVDPPPPDPVNEDPGPADIPPIDPDDGGGTTDDTDTTPDAPPDDPFVLPGGVAPAVFNVFQADPLAGTGADGTRDSARGNATTPPKFLHDAVANIRSLLDFDGAGLPRFDNAALWNALDSMRREMSELGEGEGRSGALAAQFAGGTSLVLTIGFVNWILRGGSLAAAMLSTMPMWRGLDPLPVLLARRKQDEDKDRDSHEDEPEELDRLFEESPEGQAIDA
jgi:outer membrane lipoprotein-sorting protein